MYNDIPIIEKVNEGAIFLKLLQAFFFNAASF